MKTNRIETYDRRRYKFTLVTTLGWCTWQLTDLLLLLNNLESQFMKIFLSGLSAIATLAFCVGLVMVVRLNKTLKKDSELREALVDELYLANNYKSVVYGFLGFVLICVIWIFPAAYFDVSTTSSLRIILLVGIATRLISWLILNRRETYDGE